MMPIQPEGESRRLLSLLGGGACLDLITWSDGSYGITRDGRVVGIWPAAEEAECVHAFYRLGELAHARPCVMVSRETVRRMLAELSQLN